jgi:lysozyme family protein
MKSNFSECLEMLLEHEGGYVNHPSDPGGMTNLGVTKRVYDEWIGRESTEEEMRDLTPEDVAPIYKQNYWDRVKGDQLPSGVDWCAFDWAVNSGSGRPAKAARNAPKAAMAMVGGLYDPTELGIRDKMTAAKELLDRTGLVKTEKMQVEAKGGVMLMPPKQVAQEDDD